MPGIVLDAKVGGEDTNASGYAFYPSTACNTKTQHYNAIQEEL